METISQPYLTDPEGKEHHLAGETSTIGRAIENSVVITSKRVSREHACIYRQGRRLFLQDLNSTNGTFLNDERLLAPVELRDGDRISIDEVMFIFHDPDVTTRDNPLPELEVNVSAGVVRVNRRPVELSPKEFGLLVYLYERRGNVCTKDEIGQAVWAEYQEGGVFEYQIENLVRRLRTRIENDPASPQVLLTVRGLGYKLNI
jgi:pSer/pThr/pTyr-binding forkhead associated (FHA) protein